MNDDIKATRLGNIYGSMDKFHTAYGGNVWDVGGVIPTLKTSAAASQQFVIVETVYE